MNKTCKSLNCHELAAITGGKNKKKIGRCALGVLVSAAAGELSGGPIGLVGGATLGIASNCL